MGFAKSEYPVSLHSEFLCWIDTSNAAIMQETENTHIYMLYLLPAPAFPVQTWQISVSCPIFLSALEAMTQRIGLNFPKAHSTHMEAPRLCGQKLMQIFPAGSKDISSCCAFICVLKSQDPAKERKTLMKRQIYLHLLTPDEIWQKLPLYAEFPEFS